MHYFKKIHLFQKLPLKSLKLVYILKSLYLMFMPVGSSDYGASQWKGLSDIILLGVVCIGELVSYISSSY